MNINGVITALVTPFESSSAADRIDYASLMSLIDWQIEQGVAGFVVAGTTGESATLSGEEKKELFSRVVQHVAGRVPVIANTGSNATAESVACTTMAREVGVDAVLAVTPYYNKPSQAGCLAHFFAIADIGLPVIIYDIPGRSVIDLSPQTLLELSKHDNIIGVKEATDSGAKILALTELLPPAFQIWAGEDHMTYFVLAAGGAGVISASSNAIPREMVSICEKMKAGDIEGARAAQQVCLPMIRAFFSETNPAPVKTKLHQMKRIASDAVRLPLLRTTDETASVLGALASD